MLTINTTQQETLVCQFKHSRFFGIVQLATAVLCPLQIAHIICGQHVDFAATFDRRMWTPTNVSCQWKDTWRHAFSQRIWKNKLVQLIRVCTACFFNLKISDHHFVPYTTCAAGKSGGFGIYFQMQTRKSYPLTTSGHYVVSEICFNFMWHHSLISY